MHKIILFSVFFLIAMTNLYAQDSTSVLEEVWVTANKYPSKSNSTGKVVKVITRQQLERSGGKDLAQVLTEQAGIFIAGANSNPGKDKSVYIRGAKVDYTLITIDGVPVYDASGVGSNFDIRLLGVDQIERIEVLSGSQSTLYGSDAMAGVINIITKKAGTEKVQLSGNLSYGSNQTLRTGLSMSFRMKKWDYQIQVAQMRTSGIDEAVKNTSVRQNRDRDEYNQFNIHQKLSWQPISKAKITFYHRSASFNQSYDQGAFIDELDLTSTNKNNQVGIRGEWRTGNTQVFVNYNYQENKRNYWDDSTLSRNGYDIYSKGIYNSKEHFAETYAVTSLIKNIKLTMGADYRQSQSDQYYLSLSGFGPFESKLGKDSLTQKQMGVYGSANIQFDSSFFVEIGGRWNKHSAYGSNQVYGISLSKWLCKNWKLFVNTSSAYKTPSLYQLYSEYGNRSLKPEVATTWEAGAQYFLKDKTSYLRALWFKRDVKDVMFFYTDPVTYASKYVNQDKQMDQGVEADASIAITKHTQFRMNYQYVGGSITTIVNGEEKKYNNLFRRARNQFNMQLEHTFKKGWYLSAGLVSVGKRYDLWFDPSSFQSKEVVLPSYVLLNMYLSYQVPGRMWTFFADLRNLADEPYTEIYGYNTLGFNGYLGMRFSLHQDKRSAPRKRVSLPSNVGNKRHRRS